MDQPRQGAGRGRTTPVRGALVALAWLVVVLLLGHDAVMAAVAAPTGPDHHTGRADAASSDVPGNARGDEPATPHPQGCDVGWEVAPRADGDGGPAPALPRAISATPGTEAAPEGVSALDLAPPSARLRRALLQVYRI